MKIFSPHLVLTVFALLALLIPKSLLATEQSVVFVHGAWGGGWDYKHLQKKLEQKGFDVYRPTLTGLGERSHLSSPKVDLDTHIMDIVNLIEFESLNNVILVGHSYGGMVITGVADKIPAKIKHLLYLDALLPKHRESVLDLMEQEEATFYLNLAKNYKKQNWSIPPFWDNWGKDVPHPLASYQQKIVLSNPQRKSVAATYVLTVEKGESEDMFSPFANRAKSLGWNYKELTGGHNIHRELPDAIVKIISNIKE